MASVAYYELYRGSSLGLSLTDTLDDLINEGRIEPQLAMKILGTFDKVVTEVLAEKVRARLTFKGHLDTYRFCDEVWTFLIKDVSFKLDNQTTVTADKVKILRMPIGSVLPFTVDLYPKSRDYVSSWLLPVCSTIMPRTLPWLRTGDDERGKKESTPRKRVKPEPSPDRDITPKNPPVSPNKRDFFRSSQSPPTSPPRQPPREEFLIEGIEHDDGWIMVEDEFYAVAQTFTQHLHHAEYLRRRKEVKAANAAGLREIERPTDGRTPLPKEADRKKEAEILRDRQKAGLAQIEDPGAGQNDEDDDDERWAGTHLHDLMTSPRKSRALAGVSAPKSFTRAAAGFGQAPLSSIGRARVNSIGSVTAGSRAPLVQSIDISEETASSSEDDLDLDNLPVVLPTPKRTKVAPQQDKTDDQTTHPPPPVDQKSEIRNTSTLKRTAAPVRRRSGAEHVFKSRVQSLFDELDELPESSLLDGSASIGNEEPSEKQSSVEGEGTKLDPKESRHNEVPTFLV
ncbi:Transcription initiation factor IIA gamma subunit [Penicillium sp. DV-2018c]|nr:Transcription initiation factor IIA gamma subunit [Penicillium sp. DV-2018c]